MAPASGTLRLAFPSPDAALAADAALAPDDDGSVWHRVEGDRLVVGGEADSWMGLLRSLDDVLTCLRVLEGADAEGVSADRREDSR